MADTLTVFVGNLPFSATEDEVRDKMEGCGQITDFRFPCYPDTGKPKGCAIITFASPDGMARALDLHESDFGGRNMLVRRDEEKGKGKDGGKGKGKGKGKDKGYGKGKGDFFGDK